MLCQTSAKRKRGAEVPGPLPVIATPLSPEEESKDKKPCVVCQLPASKLHGCVGCEAHVHASLCFVFIFLTLSSLHFTFSFFISPFCFNIANDTASPCLIFIFFTLSSLHFSFFISYFITFFNHFGSPKGVCTKRANGKKKKKKIKLFRSNKWLFFNLQLYSSKSSCQFQEKGKKKHRAKWLLKVRHHHREKSF